MTKTISITAPGNGNDLFYDTLSGRYFWGDFREVEDVVESVCVGVDPINDVYDKLGIPTVGAGVFKVKSVHISACLCFLRGILDGILPFQVYTIDIKYQN